MADPPRRGKQQRPLATHLVTQTATVNREKPDLGDGRHHIHRLCRFPAKPRADARALSLAVVRARCLAERPESREYVPRCLASMARISQGFMLQGSQTSPGPRRAR